LAPGGEAIANFWQRLWAKLTDSQGITMVADWNGIRPGRELTERHRLLLVRAESMFIKTNGTSRTRPCRKMESLVDKFDAHAAGSAAVSHDSSVTPIDTARVPAKRRASVIMEMPSASHYPPHGRCVKKSYSTVSSSQDVHPISSTYDDLLLVTNDEGADPFLLCSDKWVKWVITVSTPAASSTTYFVRWRVS
jgi:hypothetical protein